MMSALRYGRPATPEARGVSREVRRQVVGKPEPGQQGLTWREVVMRAVPDASFMKKPSTESAPMSRPLPTW